jgi:hypothetical protein
LRYFACCMQSKLLIVYDVFYFEITIEIERVSRCENWIQQLKDWSSKLTVLFVPMWNLMAYIIEVVFLMYWWSIWLLIYIVLFWLSSLSDFCSEFYCYLKWVLQLVLFSDFIYCNCCFYCLIDFYAVFIGIWVFLLIYY